MSEPACPGCGLEGGPADGPTHPYMLSSPRCWQLYTELLATAPMGQKGIDAYAVQHPGVPERRAIQSVGAHLVSLCAAFEHDWPPAGATDLVKRAVEASPGWVWLDSSPPVGTITVDDVIAEPDLPSRLAAVDSWARDVWAAYSDHHATVRSWLEQILGD
ncbi:MAG TPA: DUF5946 family protein [Acidimicrobiia bacterium]|nr:DUF5946 family protein [Acidimicrobiia bacterium]